jgi:hypothetical protein
LDGLGFSIVKINLAAPAIVQYYSALGDFHLVSRAAGPRSQLRPIIS